MRLPLWIKGVAGAFLLSGCLWGSCFRWRADESVDLTNHTLYLVEAEEGPCFVLLQQEEDGGGLAETFCESEAQANLIRPEPGDLKAVSGADLAKLGIGPVGRRFKGNVPATQESPPRLELKRTLDGSVWINVYYREGWSGAAVRYKCGLGEGGVLSGCERQVRGAKFWEQFFS